MNLIFFLVAILLSTSGFTRNVGETEITTDEGIEVFQKDKYYVLNKNVKIESDNFLLLGDNIKIYFNNDLYDIEKIDAKGNVRLDSEQYRLKGSGENLIFIVESEEIYIKGINSKLNTSDFNMQSDGEIKVNNLDGEFIIIGRNSSLVAQNIYIEGNKIDGIFLNSDGSKAISILNVFDDGVAYIKSENTEMYAKKIQYTEESSIIELEDNVKIIRGAEIITGDYGTLDTKNNSYKVKSKQSSKVKVIISDDDE